MSCAVSGVGSTTLEQLPVSPAYSPHVHLFFAAELRRELERERGKRKEEEAKRVALEVCMAYTDTQRMASAPSTPAASRSIPRRVATTLLSSGAQGISDVS